MVTLGAVDCITLTGVSNILSSLIDISGLDKIRKTTLNTTRFNSIRLAMELNQHLSES